MNDEKVHPKTGGVNPRRRYHSPVRREQARETRLRILDAARCLFLQDGYVATTIAAIAREAGVSAQTVYVTFNAKPAILTTLMGISIGGDDQPLSVLERSEPQRMRQETDQRRQLRTMARGIRPILDRAGPMFDMMRIAAAADADIAAAHRRLQEERLQNMTKVVEWIEANGPLSSGLSAAEAGEIMWTLTSPDVHRMLRIERGWSVERYELWLAESLIAALLP
ncbi:MAG: TetR/AcrR family transcriptional regulator [Chloroflexia bacterium]|jgi:AcrR family transcriptional regulator|nr:TetR/AcrR family transcriptional regulator [Chloroflexia bacterium]